MVMLSKNKQASRNAKRKGEKMEGTNRELLRKVIDDSGMKISAIADKTGIERTTLYNRLNGLGEFTAIEIVRLSSVLQLSNEQRREIFLI